jgi:hypothetical protein
MRLLLLMMLALRPPAKRLPSRPCRTRRSLWCIRCGVRDPNAVREPQPAIINGRPYQRPTQREFFTDYLRDSYGLPAFTRSTVRTLYNFSGPGWQPSGWGQDFPGFMQRFGSNVAITAIDGNVRYGMEELFHEDLRYIPCHGCTVQAQDRERTARRGHRAPRLRNGHRFFTLTPTVADFSGPIIAHTLWYPSGFNPFGGVIATRTVFATRVGSHLFREFVLERRHYDPKEPVRGTPAPAQP